MSCRVDTVSLIAGACVVSLYAGHGIFGSSVPSTGTAGASPIYPDLSLPADNGKQYRISDVTSLTPGWAVLPYEDTSVAVTPPVGTINGTGQFSYRLWEDGTDRGVAIETITVGTGSGIGDTTPPVLVGSISVGVVTTTTITIGWPAATDNVAVTSYEVSSDGGATWVDTGTTATSHTFIGLAVATSYNLAVRAKDAAGNVSAPALTVTQSTQSDTDTTPPTIPGALTVSSLTTTSYVLSWQAGTDNVAIATYERSIDGGLNWVSVGTATSVSIGGRNPGTTDICMVRARDTSGNISTPAISVSVTLLSGSSGITPKTPLWQSYTQLQTAISNWLHRSDTDEQIPEFIQLAEARIARDLRMTRQLSTFNITTTAGNALAALPIDWLESHRLRLMSPYLQLEYMAPLQFAQTYRADYTGAPRHFTTEGQAIRLGPVPDQAYSIEAVYFSRIPALIDQPSNWLLEDHPGIYLWGALAQAAAYIRDMERITLWEAKYRAEIEDAKKADQRAASSAGRLRIRAR